MSSSIGPYPHKSTPKLPSAGPAPKAWALQFYQLGRYAGLIVGTIIAARRLPIAELAHLESLMLIFSLLSSFWVSGLTAYLMSAPEDKFPTALSGKRSFLSLLALAIPFHAAGLMIAIVLMGVPVAYAVFFGIFSLFNSVSYNTEFLFARSGRNRALLWYAIANAALYVLCFALLYLPGEAALSVLLKALAGLGILRGAFSLIISLGHDSEKAYRQSRKDILLFISLASPLILATLIAGSMGHVDSLLVKFFYKNDPDVFVIFQYGAREFPLVALMANSFSAVMAGVLVKNNCSASAKKELQAGSTRLMHLLFPASIAIMILAPTLFESVYGSRFFPAAEIFIIYLLLSIPRLIFPQTLMTAMQRNRLLLSVSAIEWVINLVLSIVLLNFFGIKGIAFATFIAYLFDKVALMVLLNRRNIPPAAYTQIGVWLAYSLLLGAVCTGMLFFL